MSEDELNKASDEDFGSVMDLLEQEGVYLSGPIRCVDDNGSVWRENIQNAFPEVIFNNPLDNHDPSEEDVLSDPKDFDSESDRRQVLPSEYVIDDKVQINESEAVFVGLPEVISRGTCMEMQYAYMRGIPVFVWTMDGQTESGWVHFHARFVSDNRNEVMREVKECLSE